MIPAEINCLGAETCKKYKVFETSPKHQEKKRKKERPSVDFRLKLLNTCGIPNKLSDIKLRNPIN